MKKLIRPVGLFLFTLVLILFALVNESISSKPQVACGESHTLWVKSNGTLWAWGDNGFGQLGDDTILQRTSPLPYSS